MKVKVCRKCGMEFNAFGTGETLVDSVPQFGRWLVMALVGAGLLGGWLYEGFSWTILALTVLYVAAAVILQLCLARPPAVTLGKACPSCGHEDVVDRDSAPGQDTRARWEQIRTVIDHGPSR